jgi:hypothetical protein
MIIIMVIKSRRMRKAKCMETARIVCRILPGKPEGKRPLRRPNRRWKYNTEMNLKQVMGCAVNSYG